MTASPPPPPLEPLVPDVDSGTLYCCGCHYDLTGLDQAGRCPECSTLVQQSIAAARLLTASGGPVLRRGLWLIFGCLTARAVLAVVQATLAIVLVSLASVASIYLPLLAAGLLSTVLWLVEAIGWFRVTGTTVTQWFSGSERWAKVVRWALLLELLASISYQVMSWRGMAIPWVMTLASVLSLLVLLARGATIAYLGALGESPRIGRRMQHALWVVYGLGVLVAVASFVTRFVTPASALVTSTPLGMARLVITNLLQIALLGAMSQRVRAIALQLKWTPATKARRA